MLRLLIFILLLLPVGHARAQSNQPPRYTALTARLNLTDFGLMNEDIQAGPSMLLELGLRRQFTRRLGVAVPFKVGVIDVDGFENPRLTAVDLLGQFYLTDARAKVAPWLHGGVGFVAESGETSGYRQYPLGGGIDLRASDNASFSLQLEYRHTDQSNRRALLAGAGIAIRLGAVDSDNDGIPNGRDRCPNERGPWRSKGCPDKDGDGVADADDKCPNLYGPARRKGCPDTDEDGLVDSEDDCPELAGPAATGGCPDRDGDGVYDPADDCPGTPGSPLLNGCPDADEDGVADANDKCPEVAGLPSLDGCPDTDGDGITDAEDACPRRPGTPELIGCPDRDGDGLPDDLDQCPDVPGNLKTGCPDRDNDGFPDLDDKCPDLPGLFSGCPDTDKDGTPDHLDRCPREFGPARFGGCPGG